MKTNRSLLRFSVQMAIWLSACRASTAAVTIVDTFDQGGFSITPASGTFQEDVNLPLGSRREAQLSASDLSPDAVLTSTLNPSTGKLTFTSNGTSLSIFPLHFDLIYGGPGVRSIQGCTEFILGFSQLSGVGSLYIELGSSDGLSGVQHIDLTAPGDVHYPVTSLRIDPLRSLDSFDILHFRFESRSPEFSFTLDEIRLVPEPSGALLALAAGAGLLARRRRGTVGKKPGCEV